MDLSRDAVLHVTIKTSCSGPAFLASQVRNAHWEGTLIRFSFGMLMALFGSGEGPASLHHTRLFSKGSHSRVRVGLYGKSWVQSESNHLTPAIFAGHSRILRAKFRRIVLYNGKLRELFDSSEVVNILWYLAKFLLLVVFNRTF